jgi:hypothetical protein
MRTTRSLLPMMLGKAVALLEGALEVRVLVFEPPPGDHAVDLDDQLVVVPGLGEIIVGAELEGADGGFHRAVGGDQEDGRLAVALADLLVSTSMPERSGIMRSSSTRS